MKFKTILLIYLSWMSCRCIVHAQLNPTTSNYALRHFTPSTGLNSTQTRGITQDSLGYIWIGSGIGLNRYDGYTFKSYEFDPDNKLKSAFRGGIRYLLTDPKGNVWAVSEILSRFDNATDRLIHYLPELDLLKVFRFCFEKTGQMVWMGTIEDGLYGYDTQTNKTSHYPHFGADSVTNAKRNSVWGISDRGGSLLLATRQGLWNFDKATGRYTRPDCNPRDSSLLFNSSIWHIIDWPKFDPDDTWLVLEYGLIKLDRHLSIVQRVDYPEGFRTNAYRRDVNGFFWLKSNNNNELFRFDPLRGTFNLVDIKLSSGSFVFERDIFIDREHTIWSGSEASGAYQLIPQTLSFYNFNFPRTVHWTVSSIYRSGERDKIILACTRFGEPSEFWTAYPVLNQNMDSVDFQKVEMKSPFAGGAIMSTAVDKNTLWICTYDMGITGMKIDPKGRIEPDNRFTLKSDPDDPNTISNEANAFAYVDHEENLWIVSRGNGLTQLDLSKQYGSDGSIQRFKHQEGDSTSLSHDFSLRIKPADNGALWVLTWAGLDLFQQGRFHHVLTGKATRTVLKSSDGVLYIGTIGALYKGIKEGEQYKIEEVPIFTNHYIEDISEDQQGRLWIAVPLSDRIIFYDRKENILLEFDERDGLPTGMTDFAKASDGTMVIASVHGFTMFDPSSLQITRSGFTPALTSLIINNKTASVEVGETTQSDFSIEKHISELHDLVLDHMHNNFSIEFSSMQMKYPAKNVYRHMLVGFDDDWIESDSKNRVVSYTNLDPGTYYFKVKASNHFGFWNDKERILTIHILPPPWRTWWAYILYSLAFVGMFLLWRNYENKRLILKHRAEHLGELDTLKTRFFTNISHEFRTPITLILGPLKEMYKGTLKGDQQSVVGVMLRNAQRLSKLINQLLDLSRLESGKMKLRTTVTDLVQFLREIASSYESIADEKKIKYFYCPEVAELVAYIDVEKMEKVVHNLLSNAFKFTKENGEVILNLKAEEKQCSIIVKDSGIGIPADQLDKVFDRFYQVDGSQTREHEGSGIGMTLAKELVELHHATISVESLEGNGTTFTVRLPLGKDHLNKDEIMDPNNFKKSEVVYDDLMAESSDETENEKSSVTAEEHQPIPILLIVEDNADMRRYIGKTFSDHYKVIEAANGNEGLKKAEEVIPDLIISDIMMPEMDGYKFCKGIKTNELTSHIPVILLTAKADRQSKLTGLETGADDYLSKPFDADELKLTVRNRIEERRKMRERFSREITLEPKQISITSFDEKFLTKVLAIIGSHIDDEMFSIDELSREAGYSNMHFYRKIKALSGQTPSQFLRTIRLKRAAELLRAKSDNVTQIAYSVGFNSVSYFNKCFKEQFGITPGQFAEENFNPKT